MKTPLDVFRKEPKGLMWIAAVESIEAAKAKIKEVRLPQGWGKKCTCGISPGTHKCVCEFREIGSIVALIEISAIVLVLSSLLTATGKSVIWQKPS
jgi:hypothetical protein